MRTRSGIANAYEIGFAMFGAVTTAVSSSDKSSDLNEQRPGTDRSAECALSSAVTKLAPTARSMLRGSLSRRRNWSESVRFHDFYISRDLPMSLAFNALHRKSTVEGDFHPYVWPPRAHVNSVEEESLPLTFYP
jgi:hypothetical protein